MDVHVQDFVANIHPESFHSSTTECIQFPHAHTTQNIRLFWSVCSRTACHLYQWQSSSRAYSQQFPHRTTHGRTPHEEIISWSVVSRSVLMNLWLYISFVFYSIIMLIYFGTGEIFYEIYVCVYINLWPTKFHTSVKIYPFFWRKRQAFI
jgi:hypothetical protein